MGDACGRKQKISGAESQSLVVYEKKSAARDDHVNLISRVRRLRISPARRVDFRRQSAMTEERDESFSVRLRQLRQAFFNCESSLVCGQIDTPCWQSKVMVKESGC